MVTPSPDDLKVQVGKDGYLFLANDTNRIQDQIEGKYRLGDRLIWSIAMTHAARRAFCETIGASYHHVVIPDREVVFKQFLPDDITFEGAGPRPLVQYAMSGAGRLHYFFYEPELLANRSGHPSFFRTDTHWTFDGAHRYLTAFAPAAGLDPNRFDLSAASVQNYPHPGDLGQKLQLPVEEGIFRVLPEVQGKLVYDNELTNVGRMRVFVNEALPSDERTLILHDSFGEWLLLTLPLASHTTCFQHVPDFDHDFVRRFKPKRVIFMQIERFFVRPPLNGIDLEELMTHQAALKDQALKPVPDEVKALLFPG